MDSEMNNELVVKSNQVIEASYRLTLSEQRLILLCVQQIKKAQTVRVTDTFTVTAMAFADMFDTPQKNAYRELQTVADRLYDRSVTVHDPDPENPKIATTKTRWITSVSYLPDEGTIQLTFAQKMLPYIAMLEGGFTRYNLEHIANMTSVYGIRFYEFFKFWLFGSSHGNKKIGMAELKEKLELKDKYSSIKDFKLYVLDKAMSDINNASDLSASYETLKTGRKITHIEFSFAIKEKKATNSVLEGVRIYTKADLDKNPTLAHPGETYEQALKRLNKARR